MAASRCSVIYLTDGPNFLAHNFAIVTPAPYPRSSDGAPVLLVTVMATDYPFDGGTFDPETTSILAAAFEAAWDTVSKSGSTLAAPERASATRELLAIRIMASARAGERDPKRLTNDALAHLAASR
jgi:hypothetical protein